MANKIIYEIGGIDFFLYRIGFGLTQQLQDQGHTHVFAVEGLTEVSGSGVIIDLDGDLIDAGQRMQHGHFLLGKAHLLGSQHIAVLQALILCLVIKTLPLDTGHIQHIQRAHDFFHGFHFGVGDLVLFQHIIADIAGQLQFLGGDQDKLDALVTTHGFDQRMDSAAVFQVTAQADGQIVQAAQLAVNGQQVCQGLGGMVVAAVTGIDDGNGGSAGGNIGRALTGVAHSDDICIAADRLGSIGNALALGSGGGTGFGEAQYRAAQLQHSRLETQTGTGGGLEKEGCKLLMGTGIPVLLRMRRDILGGGNQLVQLFGGKI